MYQNICQHRPPKPVDSSTPRHGIDLLPVD